MGSINLQRTASHDRCRVFEDSAAPSRRQDCQQPPHSIRVRIGPNRREIRINHEATTWIQRWERQPAIHSGEQKVAAMPWRERRQRVPPARRTSALLTRVRPHSRHLRDTRSRLVSDPSRQTGGATSEWTSRAMCPALPAQRLQEEPNPPTRAIWFCLHNVGGREPRLSLSGSEPRSGGRMRAPAVANHPLFGHGKMALPFPRGSRERNHSPRSVAPDQPRTQGLPKFRTFGRWMD